MGGTNGSGRESGFYESEAKKASKSNNLQTRTDAKVILELLAAAKYDKEERIKLRVRVEELEERIKILERDDDAGWEQ